MVVWWKQQIYKCTDAGGVAWSQNQFGKGTGPRGIPPPPSIRWNHRIRSELRNNPRGSIFCGENLERVGVKGVVNSHPCMIGLDASTMMGQRDCGPPGQMSHSRCVERCGERFVGRREMTDAATMKSCLGFGRNDLSSVLTQTAAETVSSDVQA